MKNKIINLILSAGWHEGEISVVDDIMALYMDEVNNLKRKIREAETLIKELTKNAVPEKPAEAEIKEPIPSAEDYLGYFSLSTKREMFFNNMLTRIWAIEAIESYVLSFYEKEKNGRSGTVQTKEADRGSKDSN